MRSIRRKLDPGPLTSISYLRLSAGYVFLFECA